MFALIWATVLFTATVFPRIKGTSACKSQWDVLVCVCVSEGFPRPTIRWPLLENISEFTMYTSSFDSTVTSNITVPLKKISNIVVECISDNKVSITTKNLTIEEKLNYTKNEALEIIFKLKEIFEDRLSMIIFGIGILVGSLVSGFIACLTNKCHRYRNRKKKSVSREQLKLVSAETISKGYDNEIPHVQGDDIPDIQNDGIQILVAADCGEDLAGDLIDSDMSQKEVVYSDIDFFALKTKNQADPKEMEVTTETEYAEIKRGDMEEAQENEELNSEILEGSNETEGMIEPQEVGKKNMFAEDVIGEDVPLY